MSEEPMSEQSSGRGALAAGLVAIFAVACCLAPLALAALGAWIGLR